MSPILKLTLLENSHSFMAEALAKALLAETDVHQWKFAILHMCQAVELSLKERLRREHPALILESLDKGTRTVSPTIALLRLSRFCNVAVSKTDLELIENATKWRNEIVHSEFSLNVTELKSAFSVLLGFIRSFHDTVLQDSLADHLPKELWTKALAIQEYGDELFSRALQQIKSEGVEAERVIACPRCGRASCVLMEDTCRCYVCNSSENLIECESCHSLVPESQTTPSWTGITEDEMWETHICRACMDRGKEEYIQHLIDLRRGK